MSDCPKHSGACSIRLCIVLSAFAGVAFGATHVNKANYIYLNADDPGGTYSWEQQLGRWADGATGSTEGVDAPDANHDYLVQGNVTLRGINVLFKGRSLTLDDGGKIKAVSPNVNPLIVYDGWLSQPDSSAGSVNAPINGRIELQSGGGQLSFEVARQRCYLLLAKVVGDADSVLRLYPEMNPNGQSINPQFSHLRLAGDNSGFNGQVKIESRNASYPAAVSATTLSNIGAGDPSASKSVIDMNANSYFLGTGLNFNNPGYSISATSGVTFGSFTNLSNQSGLKFDGGVKIKLSGSDPAVSISNLVGKTELANVVFESAGTVTLKLRAGLTVFKSTYNQPAVKVVVCEGADFTVEPGAKLGTIAFESERNVLGVALTPDPTWLTNNVAFSTAVFSSPSLGTTVALDDFDLYGGVPREQFKIENDGNGVPTLYWYREADAHPVRWMKADDGGSSSFAAGLNWCDGAAPTVANDYAVCKGGVLRARANALTFAGNVLRVLSGGDFSSNLNSPTVYTAVPHLELYEGGWTLLRGDYPEAELRGAASVFSSRNGYAAIEVEGGTYKIAATLSGTGNLRYYRLATKTHRGGFYVKADNSGLTGKVMVGNTDKWGNGNSFTPMADNQASVWFNGENAIGGNPAKFVADGLTMAPYTTFICTNGYPAEVTQPNRGVTLLGEGAMPVAFDVAAGLSCRMLTPICGPGRLSKRGEGTLVLGAANTFSGGVCLEGGTLVLSNANAMAGSRLIYTNGTLRIACAGPVKIASDLQNPITQPQVYTVAGDQFKVPVELAAWDAGRAKKGQDVFLFPDSTTGIITTEWLDTWISLPQLAHAEWNWKITETEAGVLVSVKVRNGIVVLFR